MAVGQSIVYPFVVDAETWETVAHATVPGREGVCCSHTIAESNDLDDIRTQLEGTAGAWVEYTLYNPISERDEYKRVWLSMYDGHVFGFGYYGNFEQMHSGPQKYLIFSCLKPALRCRKNTGSFCMRLCKAPLTRP